jgi:hypothetical protein
MCPVPEPRSDQHALLDLPRELPQPSPPGCSPEWNGEFSDAEFFCVVNAMEDRVAVKS